MAKFMKLLIQPLTEDFLDPRGGEKLRINSQQAYNKSVDIIII